MKKKKQILISGDGRATWEKKVNGYLDDGWEIVPNTLTLSTCIGVSSFPVFNNAYAVVLETEECEK